MPHCVVALMDCCSLNGLTPSPAPVFCAAQYEGALVSEKSVCPPAAGALEELGAMINAPQGPLRKCKTSTVPLCDMDTKTGELLHHSGLLYRQHAAGL